MSNLEGDDEAMDIVIGKYTLESLTSGMYLNPQVLFREYVQNSIDSIDCALDLDLAQKDKFYVLIILDKENNKITIKDNGLGIPQSTAEKTLLDIGNSKKLVHRQRGFRGIGRLVGLSYTTKLIFQTTYFGENVSTEIIFDSQRLRELLRPGQYEQYDLEAVLENIITISHRPELVDEHYFNVILEGLEQDDILDKVLVSEYISQVAPLPYDRVKFSFSDKIHDAFINNGLQLEEYNIYIKNNGEKKEQLFKQFRDEFLADKQKKTLDNIEDIVVEEIRNSQGVLISLFWYCKSSYLGTILNDSIKGLRFRQGNILVGDKATANCIFKEDRFNGWFQGEVFVLDKNIIPNARRDNFEVNIYYKQFIDYLIVVGNRLSKIIRETSIERNKNKINQLNQVSDLPSDYETQDKQEDIEVSKQIKQISKENDMLRRIDALIFDEPIERQENVSQYAILNATSRITIVEKRILGRVFDAIKRIYESNEECDRVINEIISKLNL